MKNKYVVLSILIITLSINTMNNSTPTETIKKTFLSRLKIFFVHLFTKSNETLHTIFDDDILQDDAHELTQEDLNKLITKRENK